MPEPPPSLDAFHAECWRQAWALRQALQLTADEIHLLAQFYGTPSSVRVATR